MPPLRGIRDAPIGGMARTEAAAKLAKYRAKRDFSQTAEPTGERRGAHAGDRHHFVVQKHAARRLHYDFRLELDGVLLSWAVPKGPSLSPTDKRLAVRTEDHPLEYADFEGTIPKGQYGGGTVSVWDRGTWEADGDPHEAMRRGRLTFTLRGEKLRGRWHLIRTRPVGKVDSWLLFKARDGATDDDVELAATEDRSVLTGRTIDEIAADPNRRVWISERQDVGELLRQLPLGFALTNLDKVLYPEDRITKAQLLAYLAVVADWMLPHVARRPLTLVRCPEGRDQPCFFQKKLAPGTPAPIHAVPIASRDLRPASSSAPGDAVTIASRDLRPASSSAPGDAVTIASRDLRPASSSDAVTIAEDDSGETVDYMYVDDMAGLVGLAQMGTLEIHTWGCHVDKVERPDLLVFDLDPDEHVAWDRVALGAFELRKRLRAVGLHSFVKTTGGKGLHVCAPVARRLGWDDFKQFARQVVEHMAAAEPRLYTTSMTKAQRKNRIYLDYLRNGRNATFIAPYSPRRREHAPVAVPVSWEELAGGVDPAAFTLTTVPQRLAQLVEDPWRGFDELDQGITAEAWRAVGGRP
jgi:bifunctional non-homologous end joining protein LigD